MKKLIQFIEEFTAKEGGGLLSASLARNLDLWVAENTEEGTYSDSCLDSGLLAWLEDIESNLQLAEILYFLDRAEITYSEDNIGGLDDLNPEQLGAVVRGWLESCFEDPDQGGIDGYGFYELQGAAGSKVAILFSWQGLGAAKECTAYAAFRTVSEAYEWMRKKAVLDIDWMDVNKVDGEVKKAVSNLVLFRK